jgi:PAS domain S-box-containing protein
MASRLERQSRLFEQIASTTPDFIYVFDHNGRFLYANRRLLEVWGRSYDDAVGKNLYEIGYPQWHADMHMRELAQVIRTRQPIKGEVPFTGDSGISGIYEYIFTPVLGPDGNVEVIAGTTRDVTERERLLTSERSARNEAEKASQMKDEFLATLSHELRTPLHAILGWSQILARTHRQPEQIAEGLQTIERNARAQSQIIDDLLDMSRIISGKVRIDLHPIDLVSVLDAAIHTVRPTAEAKGVFLSFDRPALPAWGTVAGDSNRLQQVFWNLLSNAVKFTPRAGHVHVSIDYRNEQLNVTIRDDGEGIRPDFLPYVFDRFRQADASSTRRHGGLGLGLAIVKQIVELHGGSVRAESDGLSHGSTFTVRLPTTGTKHFEANTDRENPNTTRMSSAQESDAGEVFPRLDGVRVLVIDDEPDARTLVRHILESAGAIVTTGESAEIAFSLFISASFDVLLSDIGMPGEDGCMLIRRIRTLSTAAGGAIPAVALTAYARADDRTQALQAGYQAHLIKPCHPRELLTVVESLASQARTKSKG